jgi:hypothetical protein
MDEKRFILGLSNRSKIIAWARQYTPQATQEVARELITVIECCGGSIQIIPRTVVFKSLYTIEDGIHKLQILQQLRLLEKHYLHIVRKVTPLMS